MKQLNILYFITTLFIGVFSISIISVVAARSKSRRLNSFLFFFTAFTLLILENTLFIYMDTNLHFVPFRFFVFLYYFSLFSISLLMFSIAYSSHVVFDSNFPRIKNILAGVISFVAFLIPVFFTRINEMDRTIIDYSFIKPPGITVQILFLFLSIIYLLINGAINMIRKKDVRDHKKMRYMLVITAIFAPTAIIDNIYPRILEFPIYPISYCIFGILSVYFILKDYFKAEHFENHKVPKDDFYKTHDISEREREVLLLILEGYSNKKICDKLFISLSTVKTHVANIFQKTNVKSRFELITLLKRRTSN